MSLVILDVVCKWLVMLNMEVEVEVVPERDWRLMTPLVGPAKSPRQWRLNSMFPFTCIVTPYMCCRLLLQC